MEQWIGEEKKICRAGDVIFIEPGVVHASFNVEKSDAKLLAIFGNKSSSAPLAVNVSAEEPWRGLRS